jgi:hypothetical protein
VEKLSIQDASRRLNISQRDVRDYIRNGELKAERDPGSEHGRWLVLMPEGDWQDKFKSYLDELDASITRWWWTNVAKTGSVHYLENTGIENVERPTPKRKSVVSAVRKSAGRGLCFAR